MHVVSKKYLKLMDIHFNNLSSALAGAVFVNVNVLDMVWVFFLQSEENLQRHVQHAVKAKVANACLVLSKCSPPQSSLNSQSNSDELV